MGANHPSNTMITKPRYDADALDDLPDDRQRPPTSTRRYHPGTFPAQPDVVAQARRTLGTQRASRLPQPLPRSQQAPVLVQPDLDDGRSVTLAPHMGQRMRAAQETEEITVRRKHPTRSPHMPFLIKVGLALAALWFLGTSGLSWWDTHIADPATYGPTHGEVATGVFGGGDSPAQPTKLMAMNNDGQVEIIEMVANDPNHTRILVGPNLVASNFPDPGQAEVSLQVVQQGSQEEVQVTVWSNSYALPFLDRVHQTYTLVSDGKGNLKVETEH